MTNNMQPFAIVFTCAPTRQSLTPQLVAKLDTLRGVAAHVSPVWLNPGTACEVQVTAQTDTINATVEAIRAELETHEIDVNAVANDRFRRKALLLADMDSTIIQQECIDEIATFAGVGSRVSEITERAMRGEIDFDGALRERVGLLEGLRRADLQRAFDERIEVMPGARVLVATMAANGAHCALVSGGFTFFTSRIAEATGFHENRANRLKFRDDALTGEVEDPILGRAAKLATLRELIEAKGLDRRQSLAVGDGANDLAMIEHAGLGVAYRAKPIVAAEADAAIRYCDLTALLYLQGYNADDFETAAVGG